MSYLTALLLALIFISALPAAWLLERHRDSPRSLRWGRWWLALFGLALFAWWAGWLPE